MVMMGLRERVRGKAVEAPRCVPASDLRHLEPEPGHYRVGRWWWWGGGEEGVVGSWEIEMPDPINHVNTPPPIHPSIHPFLRLLLRSEYSARTGKQFQPQSLGLSGPQPCLHADQTSRQQETTGIVTTRRKERGSRGH